MFPVLNRHGNEGSFFEKFLFYRGVGNFELPLKLTATGEGRFELLNHGAETIRSLFLVTVDEKQLAFARYDEVRPGEPLELIRESGLRIVRAEPHLFGVFWLIRAAKGD